MTRGAGLGGRPEWQPSPPAVAALGSDGGVLYQGSNNADAGDLFRSTDVGATWVNARLPNGGVLTIFPHAGAVYVGAYLSGLHRSTDGGWTWEPLTAGPSLHVRSMAAHSGTVYVGSDRGGVYRSPDAGVTWSPMSDGLAGDALFINRLADLEGELYLASQGSGAYRWDGASWVEAGLAGEFVDQLLPVAGVLVAGSALGEHILYSGDRGFTWVPFGQGYAGGEPYSLLADNARLYVGSRGHALWARGHWPISPRSSRTASRAAISPPGPHSCRSRAPGGAGESHGRRRARQLRSTGA